MTADEHIFADASRRTREADRREGAARFADLRKSLTRLCADEDFRAFYLYLAYEFCGADFGTRTLGEATQGIRMAMAKINETLSVADGGPALIARAAEIHFKAMGDSIVRERTRPDTGATR